MPHADNFIKTVSLCGNDPNVRFGVVEDPHTKKPSLLYKYCCNPARYLEYAVCFENEFQKMRELEDLMSTNGRHADYTRLFPSYYAFGRTVSGAPYLEMDYISGITLETFLSRSERASDSLPRQILTHEQIRSLFSQLSQAEHLLSLVGILQMDLSPKNIIICNRDLDIKLIDFTDVFFFDSEIRRRREYLKRGHRFIDGHANTALPPARQLQEAGVLLFTRLFYKGQNGYSCYRSRDPFFRNRGYFPLLDCLFQQDMDPGPAEDPCYYWDCWINQLFYLLKRI